MSKYAEIRNDYSDGKYHYIDAWKTGNDNESGTVIARVDRHTAFVDYIDPDAKTDSYAQEIIQESVAEVLKEHPHPMDTKYASISNNLFHDDFCSIGAWWHLPEGERGIEEGMVIARVDMLTGRIVYLDPEAETDPWAQQVIRETVAKAKTEHPFDPLHLERLLRSVVNFEIEDNESGEGIEQARCNLKAMGFTEEQMKFFGFPECI